MRNPRNVPQIYLSAIKSATKGLLSNLQVALFSALAYIAWVVATSLFGNFGMAGGMLLGFIQIALLTYFYSWISAVVQKEKVTFSNFHEFETPLFFTLISVAFIFFIVQFLVQGTIRGMGVDYISLFLNLGIVFLFNAIPEVIVLHRYEGLPALSYALQFTRDNFLWWFAPLLLMVGPVMLLSPESALVFFAQSDPLLPALLIFKALATALVSPALHYAALALAVVGAIWCTLFRMYLFKLLDGSVR